MTNSTITDAFLRVAEKRLEDKIKSFPLKTKSDLIKVTAQDSYFLVLEILNQVGKSLAEKGFAFEPIDSETAFQTAYDKLVEKYKL